MAASSENFYAYLDKITNRGVRPHLDRISKALEILNHPQKNYKIIHIAGTNGKGSTCSFLAHLLAASGYRVGLTLSPHVYDYRERIQINQTLSSQTKSEQLHLISEQDLFSTHEGLLKKIPDELNLTYFEWGILLALQYFSVQKVDFAVLETGLGGRWDATNICESIVSGITTISYDHMEYLGDTKEKILTEKLQIIKKNSHFLFGPEEDHLIQMAKDHCKSTQAHFHQPQKILPDHFNKLSSYLKQNLNFALNLGDLISLYGYSIDINQFLLHIDQAVPPARLEILSENPKIIVDGSHNEEGIKTLKKYLVENYGDDYDLVFGCLKNRSFLDLAQLIRSKNQNYWAQFDAGLRTTPLNIYENVVRHFGGEIVSFNHDFKNKILKRTTQRPLVVCGSFYLCAEFKEMWKSLL